jgi:hypothetical protein
MTYNGFLERLRRPGSRDLVDAVRRILAAAIGPRGDGRPPRSAEEATDYEHVGLAGLERRAKQFFGSMEATMEQHPAWRHASEETQTQARDGVEKYVMLKLHPFIFGKVGGTVGAIGWAGAAACSARPCICAAASPRLGGVSGGVSGGLEQRRLRRRSPPPLPPQPLPPPPPP